MVSIAVLGCGNIGFYIASHLIHNNHHAFDNPYNNNKIICIGRQRLLDELNFSKKLTLTKLNNLAEFDDIKEKIDDSKDDEIDVVHDDENADDDTYNDEFVILREEIIYETDLKKLIEFNPDYVIVTLKSTQTFNVFKELKDLDGKTTIVSIQNGLYNAETIKQLLPNTTIISGLISNITVTCKPNSSCHFIQCSSSSGSIILESTPDTLRFQKILQQNELPCTISSDIKSIMYSRLLINLNTSLFALSGLTYIEYLQDNDFREIYKKCVSEGLNVYKLKGTNLSISDSLLVGNFVKYLDHLPEWASKLVLEYFLAAKKQEVNHSMVYDFKLVRKTEIEFLQGEIVNLNKSIKKDTEVIKDVQGKEENTGQSVDVKYNEGILNLIKMIEVRMQESKKGWIEKIGGKEILKFVENGETPFSVVRATAIAAVEAHWKADQIENGMVDSRP